MTTPRELTIEMARLSRLLDESHRELDGFVREEARAENEYRKARANAYLATSGTVDERRSQVDKTTAEEAYAAHLAEGLAKAALESVRSKRAQLSCLQTVAASLRQEMEFSRLGPA